MPGGGLLRVVFTHREIPPSLGDANLMDNRILSVALDIKEREPEVPTAFITKDTSLRIRADAIGLIAQDYDAQRVEISELYTGHNELSVPGEAVDQMGSSVPPGHPPRPNRLTTAHTREGAPAPPARQRPPPRS